MELVGNLDLHDEARPVRVRSFHVNPYILLPFGRIRMLRIRISQLDDPMLGNQRLQEELEQALTVLLPERAFEPIVQQDAGVSPDDGFVLHNVFFPQTSEKEPFQKKIKRLSSKSAPEVPARPILPSQ
jgi:hypothetical protein